MSTKLIRVDLATYLRYKATSEGEGRSMASLAERALDVYLGTMTSPVGMPALHPPITPLKHAKPLQNRPEIKELTYEPETS